MEFIDDLATRFVTTKNGRQEFDDLILKTVSGFMFTTNAEDMYLKVTGPYGASKKTVMVRLHAKILGKGNEK